MKYFEKIQKHLNGEMSPEEEVAFKQELETNNELAREYELQQVEEMILEVAAEEHILSEIKDIRQEQQEAKKKEASGTGKSSGRIIGFKMSTLLAVAAGLALLITVYFLIPTSSNQISSTVVAQNVYLDHPPNLAQVRTITKDAQAEAILQAKLESDKPEEIREALVYYSAQAADKPTAHYFRGHGYWKLKEYEQAGRAFNQFLGNDNLDKGSDLFLNAQFYYTLALIATDRIQDAKDYTATLKDSHPLKKELEEAFQAIE